MAAPASSDLREMERELLVAAEQGEALSIAHLREEFGMGHDDLMAALDVLREHGKAVEVAPGEWRGPMQDELDSGPQEPPRVEVSVPDTEEAADPAAQTLRRLDGARRQAGWTADQFPPYAGIAGDVGPTVRLTRAIADALDAEAVGKIVKAALEGAEDGETVLLEVTP